MLDNILKFNLCYNGIGDIMKIIQKIYIILIIILIVLVVLTLNLPPKVYYKEWAAYTLWGIIALIMFIPVIYLCSDFKNKLIRTILAISYFIVFIPIFCFLIFMFSDTLHCIKHKLIKIDENYKYTIESPWLESCDYKTTYKSINFIFYQEMETEVVPCY